MRSNASTPTSIAGRRITLRTMNERDYEAWLDVRRRSHDWLVKWEPRLPESSHLAEDRKSFNARCSVRERERNLGTALALGIFVGHRFAGEIGLSGIQRGPLQTAHIGYWVDEALAGQGIMPEAVVALLQYAFEQLHLHRIEINIVPRNQASRRVVEKLGLRYEGTSERYLQIDGVWEDHARFAITSEEWDVVAPALVARWLI